MGVGAQWVNVFNTAEDGFSLGTLYRKFKGFHAEITSSLIMIKDSNNNVFGAFVSSPIKESKDPYGTGESFLFTTWPNWKVYVWSGVNEQFVTGSSECLAVGAGNGRFAIYVDKSMDIGRTDSCETFGSEPLASNQDFKIINL